MEGDAGESPRMLGPYRLEREVGRGAMGVVYSATDTRNGTRLAIKLLAKAMANDPEARKRLLTEARKGALLADCPLMVRVFEGGVLDGSPFLAMELVQGMPVGEWLDGRAHERRTADAMRLIGQLAAGLGHAHAARVVHRDIKPSNLLVDGHGNLKILDFGLAKDLRLPIGESMNGVVGTPLYMAPELLRIALGLDAYDARLASSTKLDVYSSAVTGIEMIVAVNPFARTTTYGNLLTVKATAPRRIVPLLREARLPRAWIRALGLCLASEPARRPADLAVLRELWSAPTPAVERARWRAPAAVGLAAAAVVLGSLVTPWLYALSILAALAWRTPPAAAGSRRGTDAGSRAEPVRSPLQPSPGGDTLVLSATGPSPITRREEYRFGAARIVVVIGRLVDTRADAWFVAADTALSGQGRITGSVREHLGDRLQTVPTVSSLPIGSVVAAKVAGDDPPVRHVLHAVLFDTAGGRRTAPADVGAFGACVRAALARGNELQLTSLAIPILASGCGALAPPAVAAAIVAPLVAAVRGDAPGGLVRFLLVAEHDDDPLLEAIREALVDLLPADATVARAET